ncbi:type I restriction endonuclease EcoAI [Parabacteroides goldsteinii]|uniref:restriction endonuclease subunit S n=1 Tax=Bacteroides fragilis TaxID=817 RepID=UPI001FB938F8|nr:MULTISPECIES: restriction endonuclease subunit S [Bacteroidales]MCZ2662131.1 restriction endonuclease subunit S [Bacteroides fragilis]GKG71143.1 type I restriction endonuclease EcoAI [Parabacteroides goldsteinii]GKG77096.1 type I restriction endonuclease EcoAI [Parabacteroides goldsteinii]
MDTKKLRQKILDLAIHGKLVPQDPNDEPASVLLERIKAEKERLIKEGKIKKSKKSTKASDTPHYENVPFEVPSSWVWTTLGEISNYGECNNVSVDSITDDDWVLELEDLEKDTAKIIQTLSRSKRSIKGVRHRFNKGDILYSKLRTYLNKVLVAPQSGYCTTEIMPFNSYCNVSSYYLNHVLRSAYFLDYTQQCGYGVKMPRLSTTDACNGMIPLPPLAEQKRIVKEIEHWFSLIDIIERGKDDLQTTIKQAKSKILDLAIHGKLVPQDPNDEPASELLKRINPKAEVTCDNGHYPNLPNGWVVTPMQTLCSLTDGERQSEIERVNLDVKYLRGERETKTLTAGRYTPANTLLILVDGENSGEVFRTPIEGYQGSTFKLLSINDNMNTDYVLQVINLHRKTLRENKVGSAIPHLNKKLFKAIEVPIPPYKEQQRIVNAINRAFQQLDIITGSL